MQPGASPLMVMSPVPASLQQFPQTVPKTYLTAEQLTEHYGLGSRASRQVSPDDCKQLLQG